MSKEPLKFPERRDAVRGWWRAIYIEPCLHGGERLCVAVAVVTQTAALVVPVLGLARIGALYGKENGEGIQSFTQLVIEELTDALKDSSLRHVFTSLGDFGVSWVPPLEGFYFGEMRVGEGNTLEEIAASGLLLSSSLYISQREQRVLLAVQRAGGTADIETIIRAVCYGGGETYDMVDSLVERRLLVESAALFSLSEIGRAVVAATKEVAKERSHETN